MLNNFTNNYTISNVILVSSMRYITNMKNSDGMCLNKVLFIEKIQSFNTLNLQFKNIAIGSMSSSAWAPILALTLLSFIPLAQAIDTKPHSSYKITGQFPFFILSTVVGYCVKVGIEKLAQTLDMQ